jgi:hypothetical protein
MNNSPRPKLPLRPDVTYNLNDREWHSIYTRRDGTTIWMRWCSRGRVDIIYQRERPTLSTPCVASTHVILTHGWVAIPWVGEVRAAPNQAGYISFRPI